MSTLANAILRGTHASRPTDNATGTTGRLYYETDTHILFRDNGSSWDNCEATGTGDVVGPGSATNGNLAVFDGTTGKLIKDGGAPASGGVARSGATTDGHLAVWNGSSADSIKDGGAALADGTWTDYTATSTVVGWSSFTTKYIYYKKVGTSVYVMYDLVGTSNSTSTTFTLPYAAVSLPGTVLWGGYIQDNGGSDAITPGVLTGGTSTATIYKTAAFGAFTATGAKSAIGQFWYVTT